MPNFQRTLDNALVAKGISEVYSGPDRIIHNPYQSTPTGSDGAAATAYSIEDFTLTDDTLSVSRRATVAEHIDNIEMLQARYDLAMERAERQAFTAKNYIDKYVLGLYTQAGITIDGPTIGAAAGSIALTSTNVDDVANAIVEKLAENSAAMDRGMFWVVSPKTLTKITSFMQNNGFNIADASIKNGFTGGNFAGLDIYVSNNLTTASSVEHSIAGIKGSLFLALPSDGMEYEKKAVSGKHGREVVTSHVYNATIWNNLQAEVADVRITA